MRTSLRTCLCALLRAAPLRTWCDVTNVAVSNYCGPCMDSPQSPGPAPKSPLPRLDSARKGASFYDRSAFIVAMALV